ncbi:disintegrin and metalloproteinase domain-containing protein 5-like [Loxodonta africana]|uniref:disintegrin and metalloproteinase domain-containing protein 5-like n=1 Tax=Loxodonta africana TaxID=9785 RepID=UPI000C81283B|nr:disintegrin and metalloproteinase domain-containing protein 5-like [Loxodonta africana]
MKSVISMNIAMEMRVSVCLTLTYTMDIFVIRVMASVIKDDVGHLTNSVNQQLEEFCIRFECKETRFFMDLHDCDATRDCNKSGICNNFNHCHCNKGFVPPSCKAMKGQFGSVDDGHQFPEARSSIQKRYATSPKHQLLLIGYVCLPVLIILTAILIMQNKLREFFYGEETEDERSVTEESSSSSKLSLSSSNSLSQL